MRKLTIIFIIVLTAITSSAQNPFHHYTEAAEIRYSSSHPVIHYTVHIDEADYSSFSIEMRIQNITDTFHVAMVTHPEYDDKFWRHVKDFKVTTENTKGQIIREDSSLWKIIAPGGKANLQYRIQLPPSQAYRGAWRPFLNSTGSLFGGPHSFMYVLGATLAPSHITLQIPKDWKIITGLVPTSDPNTFFAPTVSVLTDGPILVGIIKKWQFFVEGIPHTVAYYPLNNSVAFDTILLVSNIEKFVRQASSLFGRLPYRDYSFQLQDGAYGGLEHRNSVTLGVQSQQLAKDMTDFVGEMAHEYFHSWNLMRIHPIEYGDVGFRKQPLSKGLWFSEGLTMFYADLLLRRAGIPVEHTTRINHLEWLIQRYYSAAGNREVSPEKVSLASYGPEGMLGDYSGSSHLQGELLGTIFDLIIRDATNGRKSMDDVMRLMMEKFSGEKGFTGKDIESALKEISGRDFHQFFEDHVRGNKIIDFNKYLSMIGMKMELSSTDAVNEEGKPLMDFRAYAFQRDGESIIRFGTTDPQTVWAKAGLHTGDVIKSVNDTIMKTPENFFRMIRKMQMGDRVIIEVQRASGSSKIQVIMTGYKRAVVNITEKSGINERQKKLMKEWNEGGK